MGPATQLLHQDGQLSKTKSGTLSMIAIVVNGLRKASDSNEPDPEKSNTERVHAERILVPQDDPLSVLWEKIESLGYHRPDSLQQGEKIWKHEHEKKLCVHPFEELEIVRGRPSENGKCINIDDRLIAFTNRYLHREINLNISGGGSSDHTTRLESLKDDWGLDISFQRTARMPDDDRLHQLPASLGVFPLYNVSAYSDRLPDNIVQQGGVFLPMWQREALWIRLQAPGLQRYALRIFVGRINAVSGLRMDDRTDEAQATGVLQDYVVVPGQQWLDGICVSPGIVRQFVAMPWLTNTPFQPEVGSGYTVEGQKTGEEKYGGVQIEIIPSYERRLRTFLSGSAERLTTDELFDQSRELNEDKTPLELGLSVGDKIRSYPPIPTYWAPYAISDLTGDASKEDTHIKALYRERSISVVGNWVNGGSQIFGYGYSDSSDDWVAGLAPDLKAKSSPLSMPGTKRTHHGESFNLSMNAAPASTSPFNTPLEPEEAPSIKVMTKDLKAMGLAAGGKLVQDIYRDPYPARIWNTEATRLVNIHILDPASCEKVTHMVPPPPPIGAAEYAEAKLPFYVVEEQVDNRLEGGDFDNVISVSAMDKDQGVTSEPAFDPSKPTACRKCELRLCDCIVRPCDHQFCNVCVRRLDTSSNMEQQEGFSSSSSSEQQIKRWKCPTCGSDVSHVAGFSAPMNLPGEEALRVKVPVHVLKVEDGRVEFKSIQTTRI